MNCRHWAITGCSTCAAALLALALLAVMAGEWLAPTVGLIVLTGTIGIAVAVSAMVVALVGGRIDERSAGINQVLGHLRQAFAETARYR